MEALGALLLLAGATGGAVLTPRLQARGQGWLVPVVAVPVGAAVGAGAALIRGWDLLGTTLAGALVVPLLTAVVRIVEVRRGATSERRR